MFAMTCIQKTYFTAEGAVGGDENHPRLWEYMWNIYLDMKLDTPRRSSAYSLDMVVEISVVTTISATLEKLVIGIHFQRGRMANCHFIEQNKEKFLSKIGKTVRNWKNS